MSALADNTIDALSAALTHSGWGGTHLAQYTGSPANSLMLHPEPARRAREQS